MVDHVIPERLRYPPGFKSFDFLLLVPTNSDGETGRESGLTKSPQFVNVLEGSQNLEDIEEQLRVQREILALRSVLSHFKPFLTPTIPMSALNCFWLNFVTCGRPRGGARPGAAPAIHFLFRYPKAS